MDQPSPRAHLVRLFGILLLGIAGFVVVRGAMEPETWSHEDSYRKAALEDLAKKPSIHGGKSSCIDCHQEERGIHQKAMDTLMDGVHASLNCEACHGPLAHHVADGKKIAEARIESSRVICLSCHNNLISLPPAFPKMILPGEELTPQREAELVEAAKQAGGSNFYRHKKNVRIGMNCTECHVSFHDPEP